MIEEIKQQIRPDWFPELQEEEEDEELQEEQHVRPVRKRRAPDRLQYFRPDAQESNQKGKPSPRARKRLQSQARFKRKEEVLRTEMKIRERWVLSEEGME